MQHALFFPPNVDVRNNTLKHDNVVTLAKIDDLAFDVGEAFCNQRRADSLSSDGRDPKFGELVSIAARACSDAYHLIQHVNSGNGNHALLGF